MAQSQPRPRPKHHSLLSGRKTNMFIVSSFHKNEKLFLLDDAHITETALGKIMLCSVSHFVTSAKKFKTEKEAQDYIAYTNADKFGDWKPEQQKD